MTDGYGLVADIGGTNARFALVGEDAALGLVTIWPTAKFATLAEGLQRFLAQEALRLGVDRVALTGAAICAAGPLAHGTIRMTNATWTVAADEVAAATGVARPIVVNDFTALAHAIPALKPGETHTIGAGAWAEPGQPIGVLGPGTGLGVSALIPDDDGDYVALSGEGGHADLPVTDDREYAVIRELRRNGGHVSAERALSGPGLEAVYAALATLAGKDGPAPAADAIAAGAARGDDPLAVEAVRLFCGWLGTVAGDLALTLGARGGVYLAGGILPKWGALFDAALFRRRFEAKGRFDDYLRAIPTYLMVADEPAFRGLARLLARPARAIPRRAATVRTQNA
jgi:glucokinase